MICQSEYSPSYDIGNQIAKKHIHKSSIRYAAAVQNLRKDGKEKNTVSEISLSQLDRLEI